MTSPSPTHTAQVVTYAAPLLSARPYGAKAGSVSLVSAGAGVLGLAPTGAGSGRLDLLFQLARHHTDLGLGQPGMPIGRRAAAKRAERDRADVPAITVAAGEASCVVGEAGAGTLIGGPRSVQ